jgi:predicted RNA-binding protein with RPS1 domain
VKFEITKHSSSLRIGQIVNCKILKIFPKLKYAICGVKGFKVTGLLHVSDISSFFVKCIGKGEFGFFKLFNGKKIKVGSFLKVKVTTFCEKTKHYRFSYKEINNEQLRSQEFKKVILRKVSLI